MDERQRFGRFYFRFPNGEAVTDVYDRVNDFWQDMAQESATGYERAPVSHGAGGGRARRHKRRHKRAVDDVVLVTHGLLMRTFCMSYLVRRRPPIQPPPYVEHPRSDPGPAASR